MPVYPDEYERLVLDDIKGFEKLNRPVKVGFMERMLVKKLPLC